MEELYSWPWVEAEVAQTVEEWKACAVRSLPALPRFSVSEQRQREKACDQGMRALERNAREARRTPAKRNLAQQRIEAAVPRLATIALGLDGEAVELLRNGFLPVGTQLARWARDYDPTLSLDDTIQACRNAWICCGLQALLGQPIELTPSILAYSLLYPYSDNYLDQPGLSKAEKLLFSERFRQRLRGQRLSVRNLREAAVWAMVQMIEEQYARPLYPQVYESLLAIHQAQEQSLAQLDSACFDPLSDGGEVLRISCAKGGSSVIADACLAQPWLTAEESRFSFAWGVLLQLGDDLQDVRGDLERGSATLFTRAAAQGQPLDSLAAQLLHFSERVAEQMDRLPYGTPSLKNLMRTSWRLLILLAVADARQFFSPAFLAELEPCSPFRFDFLRTRSQKLAGRQALYATLFDSFLETGAKETADNKQLTVTRSKVLAVCC
jgi:hypothetical protein